MQANDVIGDFDVIGEHLSISLFSKNTLRRFSGACNRKVHGMEKILQNEDKPLEQKEEAKTDWLDLKTPLPWWEALTDKDHEALGAMLIAMRPRDDRRDET